MTRPGFLDGIPLSSRGPTMSSLMKMRSVSLIPCLRSLGIKSLVSTMWSNIFIDLKFFRHHEKIIVLFNFNFAAHKFTRLHKFCDLHWFVFPFLSRHGPDETLPKVRPWTVALRNKIKRSTILIFETLGNILIIGRHWPQILFFDVLNLKIAVKSFLPRSWHSPAIMIQ